MSVISRARRDDKRTEKHEQKKVLSTALTTNFTRRQSKSVFYAFTGILKAHSLGCGVCSTVS